MFTSISHAEQAFLHTDDDEEQMEKDEEMYLKYLGTDYEKYVEGIAAHNEKHNRFGGFWRDVCHFFEKIDKSKKIALIAFFENTNKELFKELNKLVSDEDKIKDAFNELIETRGNEIEKITGIYKKDLHFLFRGEDDKKIGLAQQLSFAQIDYYHDQSDKVI